MKKNCWLIVGAMLSTSVMAQQATNTQTAAPVATPAPAAMVTNAAAPETVSALPEVTPAAKTNAPAGKAAKKKGALKKKAPKKAPATHVQKAPASDLKTVPLVAGPAVVVANNVNVRGQASLKGDVVTRATRGQTLTVLEEIVNNNSAADEPSAWAKIALPSTAHVWVSGIFVDQTNKVVRTAKLNVRSGAGEKFSVLGQLHQGEAIKGTGVTKNDWLEIEAPTNAYAFVAAQYLKQEGLTNAPATNAPAEVTKAPEPAPTPAPVTEAPVVAAAPTNAPVLTNATEIAAATNVPAASTNAPAVSTNAPVEAAAAGTNAPVTEETNAPAAEEPAPKRIVQREGLVRGTVSIQAPTAFALVSPENGRLIDYLFTSSSNLDLRRYKGLRIIVVGEEGLDERWGNTPVLTIQHIQVSNAAESH